MSDFTSVPLRRIPTQDRSRDKVARALAAADTLARTEGPEALTLPRVAEAAGVSVGALHQYLPDRAAIVDALVARYHARFEALIDEVLPTLDHQDPAAPVTPLIDQIAAIYRDEEATRLLRELVPTSPEARRAHKARMVEKVQALLRAVGVSDASPAVARTVFTTADALMHEAFATENTAETDVLVAELRQLLSAYLATLRQ